MTTKIELAKNSYMKPNKYFIYYMHTGTKPKETIHSLRDPKEESKNIPSTIGRQ